MFHVKKSWLIYSPPKKRSFFPLAIVFERKDTLDMFLRHHGKMLFHHHRFVKHISKKIGYGHTFCYISLFCKGKRIAATADSSEDIFLVVARVLWMDICRLYSAPADIGVQSILRELVWCWLLRFCCVFITLFVFSSSSCHIPLCLFHFSACLFFFFTHPMGGANKE